MTEVTIRYLRYCLNSQYNSRQSEEVNILELHMELICEFVCELDHFFDFMFKCPEPKDKTKTTLTQYKTYVLTFGYSTRVGIHSLIMQCFRQLITYTLFLC